MSEKKKIIGEAIKKGLIKKGIKQTDLAKMMNVSQPTVSSWVTGTYAPPGDVLLEIVERLDIAAELFPDRKKSTKIPVQCPENYFLDFLKIVPDKLEQIDDRLDKLEKKKAND